MVDVNKFVPIQMEASIAPVILVTMEVYFVLVSCLLIVIIFCSSLSRHQWMPATDWQLHPAVY